MKQKTKNYLVQFTAVVLGNFIGWTLAVIALWFLLVETGLLSRILNG